MGKNKVMAVAFGRDESDEYQDNTAGIGKVRLDAVRCAVSGVLKLLMKSGESGVLMTNRTRAEVEEYPPPSTRDPAWLIIAVRRFFASFAMSDYARCGTIAESTQTMEVLTTCSSGGCGEC